MTDAICSPDHIETCPLICGANQWTCSYMIKTSVMKELIRTFSTKKKLENVHVSYIKASEAYKIRYIGTDCLTDNTVL